MPLLSVTFIGLVIGTIVAVGRRAAPFRIAARALAGAWLGFITGALCGVFVDIAMGSGSTLAVLGHAGAGAGAVATAGTQRTAEA
jgi:hypothetical protein